MHVLNFIRRALRRIHFLRQKELLIDAIDVGTARSQPRLNKRQHVFLMSSPGGFVCNRIVGRSLDDIVSLRYFCCVPLSI